MNDILFVVNSSAEHVGAHFINAAKKLGINHEVLDVRMASQGNELLGKLYWRLSNHKPININNFNKKIIEIVKELKCRILFTTGVSPILATTLGFLKNKGLKLIIFLTDDPWNPANAAGYFWKSLLEYDFVFTPRISNISDLKNLIKKEVYYLPFAYNPQVHYPEFPEIKEEIKGFACDISFIGTADKDRIPYIKELIKYGFDLKLYGGYWNKYKEFQPYYKGFVVGSELRKAVTSSRINLCLVRKANRDGHAMRTYEIPAMQGYMIVEDTKEHRDLFDTEGKYVYYFRNKIEMIEKINLIFKSPKWIENKRKELCNMILPGNTYLDRLNSVLRIIESQ